MIIYGIFVPFIFHLKRICYSFFCLRQYCDLLGYLFRKSSHPLILPMLINQKYYDKTIASIKEAFYPLWASYQLVSGIFIMK